jgi:hypothetical protein
MLMLGIDTGLDGGFALLSESGNLRHKFPMPTMAASKKGRKTYDDRSIVEQIVGHAVVAECHGGLVVYCETLHPLPAKMGGGAANYHRHVWRGFKWLCMGLRIPFVGVRPQEWQKEFGISGDTKKRAYEVASARWPNVDWRASGKCRVPHTGLVDAALIAEYGRRKEGWS